jgi:predicted dienelactone hydrolase
MLFTDILMLFSVAVFCVIWFRPAQENRDKILLLVPIFTLIFGALSAFDMRPQAWVGVGVAVIMLVTMIVRNKRGNRHLTKTPLISGLLFLALGVVTYIPFHWFPITDLPAPSGQYSVGTQDFGLTDDSRKGVLGAPDGDPRKLLVRVWYPTETTEGFSLKPYISKAEALSHGAILGGVGMHHIVHVETNSYEGAPIVEGASNLPVVYFSHGYTSFAGQNTVLMEELASRGYLVYSVQHSLDSIDTILPNGDVIPTYPKLMEELTGEDGEDSTDDMTGETLDIRRKATIEGFNIGVEKNIRTSTASASEWAFDRLFVQKILSSGEVEDRLLDIVKAGDYTHVGHSGMSFGGSTSGSVCLDDPNCAAFVNMDGSNHDGRLINASAGKPTMMFHSDWTIMFKEMTGDEGRDFSEYGFNDLSYETHEEAGLSDDVIRLRVKDVTHGGVSDFSLFIKGPLKNMTLGSIDGPRMITIMNDFVVGFFDKYVRGSSENLMDSAFDKHQGYVEKYDASYVREWWMAKTDKEREALLSHKPAILEAFDSLQ